MIRNQPLKNWGRLENTRFKTHEASLGVRYRF
ncbi:hypothetical protein HN122_002021 [Neisseria gonorrhoeae]